MTTIGMQVTKVTPIIPRSELAEKLNRFMKSFGFQMSGGSLVEYENGAKAMSIITNHRRGYGQRFLRELKAFIQESHLGKMDLHVDGKKC